MHPTGQFISGDHWVECQRCGVDYRHSEVRREWTGLIVCFSCFETRHPQDFVRGQKDTIAAQGLVNPASSNTLRSVTYDSGGNQENTVPSGTFDNSL